MISFKHAPTGRWKIETLTTKDTRDALQACMKIWGAKAVEIDTKLQERIGFGKPAAVEGGSVAVQKPVVMPPAAAIANAKTQTPEIVNVPRTKTRGGTYSSVVLRQRSLCEVEICS